MVRTLFFFLFFLVVLVPKAHSQNYQLHTVYMYSFIRYIQWPPNAIGESFEIGVLGESPITDYLNRLAATKKADNKPIKVLQFDNLNEVGNPQILFIPEASSLEIEDILTKVSGRNILLITEKEGLGLQGSNINFIVRDGKLYFELNRTAMEREELKVSSELSKLALEI